MATEPSLPRYVGTGAFLTVLVVFGSRSVPELVGIYSEEFRLLLVLLLFSVAQTSLTYLMIHDWMEAADGSPTEVRDRTDAPGSD